MADLYPNPDWRRPRDPALNPGIEEMAAYFSLSPKRGERAGVRGDKFFQPLTPPFQGRGDFIVYPECYLQGAGLTS
jgi:hypothetical protein